MDALTHFFTTAPVDPAGVAQSLWLIIALPALGALVCGVAGRWLGRANTNLIACLMVLGSFVLSLLAYWCTFDRHTVWTPSASLGPVPYALGHDFGRWFGAGSFVADYGLSVDHLSATLLLVITGVGFLIHLYSTAYMDHDEGYWRYFAYLNLFVAVMLTLVLADNLVLLFVGWEGVGLCSYLLIGFWYTDEAKAWAGRKAFITNRIGDFGFIIGMLVLTLAVGAFERQTQAPGTRANFGDETGQAWRKAISEVGPLNFQVLEQLTRHIPVRPGGAAVRLETAIADGPLAGHSYGAVLTAVLLLFLLGAAGKSAQLPLYVWLPDAMAGPTPVSALIHAATMVTAGVYLFCRVSFLLVLSPTAMAAVALVGAATALFAALIAFAQDDIKKVLAYSTVSQLGFMFLAVGVGAFWAAIYHLVTHAFFKACLFLCAGSVMHGNGDETNIRRLGGLRKEMPITWITFLVAALAITGVFPFLSGFMSKDAILDAAHAAEIDGLGWVTKAAWAAGLVAALCTAFYMGRLYLLTFEGRRSPEAKLRHAHESPPAMTIPLVVLALLAVVGGLWGIRSSAPRAEGEPFFQLFLDPVFYSARMLNDGLRTVVAEAERGVNWGAYALAWVIALAGVAAAVFLYTRFFPAHAGEAPPPALARVRRWARAKFYVDELYQILFLRPIGWLSRALYRFVDGILIDTVAVHGTAKLTSGLGSALRYLQTGDVQSYAAVMALGLLVGVGYALFQVLAK